MTARFPPDRSRSRRAPRPLRIGAAVAVLVFALAVAPVAGLDKVTFSMTSYLSSAVGRIALEEGFFEDEGLDV